MTVHTRLDGHVLVVTMNRVHKRNAVDDEMATALEQAFDLADDDRSIRATVLTGGTEVFSAGTDLAVPPAKTARGGEYGFIRRQRRVPLVVAVEGFALGGGFEMALAADLVVASSTSRFGLPEVARGVIATSGALFRAPRRLPPSIAHELLLTGDAVDAPRLFALGVVNRLTPPGAALAGALELARRIAERSPVSVSQTLAVLQAVAGRDDQEWWDLTARASDIVMASEDAREGVSAFLEKRPAVWRGR